jgi:hypothetical protein
MRTPVLITLLALSCIPAGGYAAEADCDRSGSTSTPSPDGQWIANVQEEVCATAAGGAAAGITVVLVSAGDPSRSKRVFLMAVPRSREDWPRIRWLDAKAMEVRVPNLSEAAPPEPKFEGISITLAYCEDNKADREQLAAYKTAVLEWRKVVSLWVQQRKQDPQAAGPRPPQPEEPRLAAGRCID